MCVMCIYIPWLYNNVAITFFIEMERVCLTLCILIYYNCIVVFLYVVLHYVCSLEHTKCKKRGTTAGYCPDFRIKMERVCLTLYID